MARMIFQLIAFSATFWNITIAAPQRLHHGTKAERSGEQVFISKNNADQFMFPPKSEASSAKPIYNTRLDRSGRMMEQRPFPEPKAVADELRNINSSKYPQEGSTPKPEGLVDIDGEDAFAPFSTSAPPSFFTQRGDHQVPRNGITDGNVPLQTNKFYSNFFLGSRTQSTWTNPYMIWWDNNGYFGMSISHAESGDKVFGPDPSRNPSQFYLNPLGIRSVTFSATEFGPNMGLSINHVRDLKVNVVMHPDRNNQGSPDRITFPLHQGMGFVTGLYDNLTPRFNTNVLYRSVERVASFSRPGFTKYRLTLENGKIWLIYAVRTNARFDQNLGGNPFILELRSNSELTATAKFRGIIQVAKLPSSQYEYLYDNAAGSYVKDKKIVAKTDGNIGTYGFALTKGGVPSNSALLNFVLPHHTESLVEGEKTGLQLASTTKGMMTAIVGNRIVMREDDLPLPYGMWPLGQDRRTAAYSQAQLAVIAAAVQAEINENMKEQTDLDSMYFAGKALSKFAQVCWNALEIVRDRNLARKCIDKLKPEFYRFSENRQKYPLVYDTAWKGVISSAAFRNNGDLNHDFGNPAYNDHHFHYGYHVHAAALITYLERQLGLGDIFYNRVRDYVTTLIRDFANPSSADPYFPVFRSFDWFHGHSWAKGLFESGDGKDQESSSEDAFSTYALKLWAQQSFNPALEARANLMLAIQKRSINSYFLLTSDNKNHPAQFIQNKVTGILFENKVDHVTYFGAESEKIQGIHMIPLTPISTYIRSQRFVTEEWDRYFTVHAGAVTDGWRGILMANRAIINPREAWRFFTGELYGWTSNWIDGGASRSWYLTFVGGLGGN